MILLYSCIRFLFAVMFIYSGVLKYVSIQSFENTISDLGISSKLRKIGIIMVPAAEIILGVCLLFNPLAKLCEISVMLLLVVFTWSTYRAINAPKDIYCNCFGNSVSETFGRGTYVRIVILFVLDVVLLLGPDTLQAADLTMIEKGEVGFASIGLLLIYLLLSSLIGLRKSLNVEKKVLP